MASKFPDDNAETEEETINKKRARRVSFAETTSVHFFNREVESDATPDNGNDSKEDDHDTSNGKGKLSRSQSDELMELLRSSSSSSEDDDDDDDDDEDTVFKSSFLRPLESPSSGSCFGSATSNDEDNFFGPVSAEFIRPGRLSDSGISDENHEITMDSTAFSMNFRSLARSDSGAEFKTPTGVRVPFGERTPGQTDTAPSLSDLMVLTGANKQVSQSSLAVNKVNDSGNSDDMSLVGENYRRYDYGELPPELDVLLAEGNKDVESVPLTGDVELSNSISELNTENGHKFSGHKFFDQNDTRVTGFSHDSDLSKISGKAISVDHMNREKGNDDISNAAIGETVQIYSNHVDNGPGHLSPSGDKIQATYLHVHDNQLGKKDEGGIGSEVIGMFKSPPLITQSELLHELPIEGSISSLLPKRRQIFRDSDSLPKTPLNSLHGDKEFSLNGTIDRAWSTSVFSKSVSRLKKIETSFLSASKFEGNASRLRVSGFSPKSKEKDNNVEYISKDVSLARVDPPVACLDVRFAESDVTRASGRDSYGLKNTGVVSCAEVDKYDELSGIYESLPSLKTSAKHHLVTPTTTSRETGLVNCRSKDSNESEPETHATQNLLSMQSNSCLPDIIFNDLNNSCNGEMPGDFACSPGNGVKNNVSSSPLNKRSPLKFNIGHQGEKGTDDLASTVEDYSSLLVDKINKSKLTSFDTNHAEDVLQHWLVDENQLNNSSKSALKDKVSKSCNVISSNDDVDTRGTLISSTKGLRVQNMHSVPGSTLSSNARSDELPEQVFGNPNGGPVYDMLNETLDLRDDPKANIFDEQDDATLNKLISKYTRDDQLVQKLPDIYASDCPSSHKRKLFDDTQDYIDHASPLQRKVFGNPNGGPVYDMLKETLDLRDDPKANIFYEQDDATLNKLISKYTRDDQLLQKPPDIRASDCPSSHKRKLFDDTQDYIDHASPLQRKARLCKDQTNYEEKRKVSHCIANASESRDWTDVFTSLCRVTKELLNPTSDKFDVALIAKLADILVHLDKLKSYELLHHELGSRKSLDSAHFVHSKRLANTKLLLYSTVYQKAKLQLLRLKRDKLLDQAYRMKSRVEESESIMSSCHHMSKRGEIDQVGCLQLGHHSTNTDYRSSVSAEIDSLRKEVEDSDGEIRKISKSFYPYIREMKDLTSTETAESVKGLLKKMVACQLLQSELQLSEVEKLHATHGLPNVTFDHGGFLSQSFITKSTATSGLLVTNRWNKEKILKMFINDMDAYTAFSFVLSGDTQLKYGCLRNILEQTQKTVSLLHILLDVVEEVQLSMIELKSLTWSRFSQASAEKLDMQLCFTNFRSGASVTLSIDVSCLQQGVYPSEVLPYDVRGITTARNHDIFESLVADIQTAIRGAKCGFMRIMSICRCVSRMIETGGM